MNGAKKLDNVLKTSIKKKDLASFQQALMLNDTLNLFPPAYLQGLVLKLFKAKTAQGWKVALAFNGALDKAAQVPEKTLTSMYKPLVSKMSWNSTPNHLKEMWWEEVGTLVSTFVAKRRSGQSINDLLPFVSSTGIVLDWSDTRLVQQNGVVVDRQPFSMVVNVFYENGRIETVSKDLGVGKGSSNITLDQTASSIAKGIFKTYTFIF